MDGFHILMKRNIIHSNDMKSEPWLFKPVNNTNFLVMLITGFIIILNIINFKPPTILCHFSKWDWIKLSLYSSHTKSHYNQYSWMLHQKCTYDTWTNHMYKSKIQNVPEHMKRKYRKVSYRTSQTIISLSASKTQETKRKICSESLHICSFVFHFLISRKLQSFITSTCTKFFPNPSSHSTQIQATNHPTLPLLILFSPSYGATVKLVPSLPYFSQLDIHTQ
jgi:hypothetical protein